MKYVFLLVFVASLALNLFFIGNGGAWEEKKGLVYSDTIEYVDSIPFYYPVPRDSVVVRYVTETLPVAEGGKEEEQSTENDSAMVRIPITQKLYEGNRYKAYVSGFNTSIDSVFVYPEKQVIRIRDEPKRFSIGFSVGYGMTPKGFQPFVGLSATYNLFRF